MWSQIRDAGIGRGIFVNENTSNIHLSNYYSMAPATVNTSSKVKASDFYCIGGLEVPLVLEKQNFSEDAARSGGRHRGNPAESNYYQSYFPITKITEFVVQTEPDWSGNMNAAGATDMNIPFIKKKQTARVQLHCYLDADVNIFYSTAADPKSADEFWPNPGDWSRVYHMNDDQAGQSWQTIDANWYIDLPLGKVLKFAFAAGPTWQNVLQFTYLKITFPNT
jgi:hypothetical protein